MVNVFCTEEFFVRPSVEKYSKLAERHIETLVILQCIHTYGWKEGRKKGGSQGGRKEIREGRKAEVREEGKNEEKEERRK